MGWKDRMLQTFLMLLGCQAVGELLHQLCRIPLSGPIIGMVLLLIALTIRGGASEEFNRSGHALLGYLSLFFVPPGVGVMRNLPLLRAHWLPILLALILSTVLAMISGALVMQSLKRLTQRRSFGAALDNPVAGDC
jgi:holin-like protein